MPGVKIVVLYPAPRDLNKFERDYTEDHAPMVNARTFPGITKFVATKIVGTPDGTPPPFARVAELYFPSIEVLQAAAATPSAQQAVAHAISISSGGTPTFLVAEEESRNF